ncbi:alpha/beta-hydrolase [Dichomitus squalens LYAD-421 SS1]|uniref:alpha/beta-hydrolase n=1 Tax=Dichomitus squalens (strain LYAD-421) TaxID=732165 RepID=UPI0004414FCD|nr:alpha/beta-hydrolase [Dichomitus squalens LYAD-421 SS1]EJF63051.1 alpha/beta-hydrolase [Dichomitus squalens LYAD-421 SS1]
MLTGFIQDASAIQALLDQLKSSDAWRKVANPNAVIPATNPHESLSERAVPDQLVMRPQDDHEGAGFEETDESMHVDTLTSASSDMEACSKLPSVAALLSQLQSSNALNSAVAGTSLPPVPIGISSAHAPLRPGRSQNAGPDMAPGIDTHQRAPQTPSENVRACSFQQALPHLARLSQDLDVLRMLTTMKSEQIELERQLWHERREIQRKHEERVRTARTKANIIGAGLTQYEADAMTDSFRAELRKFDRERALPAWDGLVTKQQIALEALGVPAMFPSTEVTDREVRALYGIPLMMLMWNATTQRQQKIMQVTARIGCELHPEYEYCRVACHLVTHRCPVSSAPLNGHYVNLCTEAVCPNLVEVAAPEILLTVIILVNSTDIQFCGTMNPITMPYVDLVSSDDYASVWYTTNSASLNVSGFDPEKPTLVLLHSLFLDNTWLHPQMDDPRLNANFNIITFDIRTAGKSTFRPTGRFDLWVTAADLAHCFYHLHLPPAHIFAPELFSWTALRFAALFPELCLSLTLCNVTPQTELKSIFDAFEELCHLWCYAEDLESFETACKELVNCYAIDAHPDMVDELIAFWAVNYPPFRRTRVIMNANLVLNRTPMTEEELANIRCPTLIIQAERSQSHPMEYAQQLRQALVNVPNGAQLFTVKATHGYLCLLSSSIVNQVLNKFLTRQPPARSDLEPPEIPLPQRMRMALEQLSEYTDDPSIAERDPHSPLSFCCVTEEVRKSQEELNRIYSEGESSALSPLAPDGRPLRRYSERKDEHWLESSNDGFSYTSTLHSHLSARADKKKPGRRQQLPIEQETLLHMPSEPVTQEVQQVARIRRATVLPQSTADKHVIKGSMAKVIASGTATSLQRRLLR